MRDTAFQSASNELLPFQSFQSAKLSRCQRRCLAVPFVCLDAPPLTEPIGIESKQRLSARLLGKQVTVWISPYQEDGAPLNVMVLLQGGHPIDENVEQLEQGLARFRYFGPHALDSWMRCQYERAQERAQKAKIGVWTN